MTKQRRYSQNHLSISPELWLTLLEEVVHKSVNFHSTIISSRNLEAVRSSFLSTSYITSNSHALWYKTYLDTDNDSMYCIYYHGTFVGQVGLYNYKEHEHCIELGRLFVLPSYQRLGIMSRAISALIQDIQFKQAFSKIYLICKSNNLPAINMYKKLGFQPTETSTADVKKMYRLL